MLLFPRKYKYYLQSSLNSNTTLLPDLLFHLSANPIVWLRMIQNELRFFLLFFIKYLFHNHKNNCSLWLDFIVPYIRRVVIKS